MSKWIWVLIMIVGSSLLPATVRAATLGLYPGEMKIQIGQQQQVKLVVRAGEEKLVGVDAKVTWPEDLLQLVAVTDLHGFSKELGKKEGKGTLTVSYANDYSVVSSGTVEIASLTFKGLKAGVGEVGFIYEPGMTTDTNVVARGGADVLSGVETTKIESVTESPKTITRANPGQQESGKVLGVSQAANNGGIEIGVWVMAGVLIFAGIVMYRRTRIEV